VHLAERQVALGCENTKAGAPPFSLTQRWFPAAWPGKDYSWNGPCHEDTAAQGIEDRTSAKILSRTLRVLLSQVFFISTAAQVLIFFP